MSDVRRPIEWQQIAVILAVWSFAYGSYRAYYAVGGELGMIGQPSSSAQFRAINAIGAAAIILFGSVVPLAAMYVRAVRRALLILCWIAAVGCCMHALVDIALRVFSVTGVHPTELPSSVWLSFDRRAADMQDLLLNEPWFLAEGLLWGWLGVTIVQPSRRRTWVTTVVAGCILLTVVGVMSGLGIIGSFRVG